MVIHLFTETETMNKYTEESLASDGGVGAVLSQRSEIDQKLHPCADFSRKLSSTKRNYDIHPQSNGQTKRANQQTEGGPALSSLSRPGLSVAVRLLTTSKDTRSGPPTGTFP